MGRRGQWVLEPSNSESDSATGSTPETVETEQKSSSAAGGKRKRSVAGAESSGDSSSRKGIATLGEKKKYRRVSVSYSSKETLKRRLNSKKEPAPHLEYCVAIGFSIKQELLKEFAQSTLGDSLVELTIIADFEDSIVEFGSVRFPKMESLTLDGLGLKTVTFTQHNTPKLKKLTIIDPMNKYIKKFDLDLPFLRSAQFDWVSNDGTYEDFEKSIAKCPNLELFRSRKLWNVGGTLILPNCKSLTFSRPDGMETLALWAPRIEEIHLLACHSLERVDILDEIPDVVKKELVPFEVGKVNGEPSKYVLNLSSTGPIEEGNIKTHRRCLGFYGEMSPSE